MSVVRRSKVLAVHKHHSPFSTPIISNTSSCPSFIPALANQQIAVRQAEGLGAASTGGVVLKRRSASADPPLVALVGSIVEPSGGNGPITGGLVRVTLRSALIGF